MDAVFLLKKINQIEKKRRHYEYLCLVILTLISDMNILTMKKIFEKEIFEKETMQFNLVTVWWIDLQISFLSILLHYQSRRYVYIRLFV